MIWIELIIGLGYFFSLTWPIWYDILSDIGDTLGEKLYKTIWGNTNGRKRNSKSI